MAQQKRTVEEIPHGRTKLHGLRTNCGCKSGMAALLLSVILCVYYFGHAEGMAYSRQHKIVVSLMVCLGAAAGGKVLGMVWGRYR